MAAASSGHEDWRKCHEVDLRRLRQRGSRRGRIRGEVHLGDSGERRPLPLAEGRDHVAMCLLGRLVRELDEVAE